jgi:hypothetical protein
LGISDIPDILDSDEFVGKLPDSGERELLDRGESSDADIDD